MGTIRKLLRTESEWNPKVALSRVLLPLMPERAVVFFKKHYYAYMLAHMPEDWIEDDAAAVSAFVSPGDTVLDVGANLGVFCRRLARLVGPGGRVYAYEPIPQTYGFLRNNLRRLGLSQVEPLPFALSDREGTETMVIPTYRWGAECWYDARIKTAKANPQWREIQVPCTTLDSFHLPRMSFIKCDVNYHELALLLGGIETIRKYHPAMLIEVNPNPDDPASSAYQTLSLLRAEGYGAYIFRQGKMSLRKVGERSQNYFFLTAEHFEHYQAKPATSAA
jgi:FkbM family methyltransferase